MVQTSTHDLCLRANIEEKKDYSGKPQFYYIKWGVRGYTLHGQVFMMFWVSDKIRNNGAVQPLKKLEVETSYLNREELYYLCSKNKGTYQVRSYCTADLRLCFFMQLVLPYQHRRFTFSDNVSNVKLYQLMEELAHMISYVTYRFSFHRSKWRYNIIAVTFGNPDIKR